MGMNRAERRRQEKAKSKQASRIGNAIGAKDSAVKQVIDEVMDDVYKRTETRIQEAIDALSVVMFDELRKNKIGVERANIIINGVNDKLFEARFTI